MLQSNGLIYVRLPENLFRISPPPLGKVILMEVERLTAPLALAAPRPA